MKKLLTILMIALTAMLAVGCAQQTDAGSAKTEATDSEPATQLHTVPPSDVLPEPEWAPVDCEIELHDSKAIYAQSKDFLTFALIGNTDEDCELRFTLNDETAAMLSQQKPADSFYLVVNGSHLKGTVSLSEDYSEVTMKGGYSYNEMCTLATEIRGL